MRSVQSGATPADPDEVFRDVYRILFEVDHPVDISFIPVSNTMLTS